MTQTNSGKMHFRLLHPNPLKAHGQGYEEPAYTISIVQATTNDVTYITETSSGKIAAYLPADLIPVFTKPVPGKSTKSQPTPSALPRATTTMITNNYNDIIGISQTGSSENRQATPSSLSRATTMPSALLKPAAARSATLHYLCCPVNVLKDLYRTVKFSNHADPNRPICVELDSCAGGFAAVLYHVQDDPEPTGVNGRAACFPTTNVQVIMCLSKALTEVEKR